MNSTQPFFTITILSFPPFSWDACKDSDRITNHKERSPFVFSDDRSPKMKERSPILPMPLTLVLPNLFFH
ncbi:MULTISPECIES: hypothetical protein [unclassified Microcoleus]|uniref:hypothetical protein n=1 Tax=unclassified Microcoleus TaxID=2642155 RepID=UPI002FD33895